MLCLSFKTSKMKTSSKMIQSGNSISLRLVEKWSIGVPWVWSVANQTLTEFKFLAHQTEVRTTRTCRWVATSLRAIILYFNNNCNLLIAVTEVRTKLKVWSKIHTLKVKFSKSLMRLPVLIMLLAVKARNCLKRIQKILAASNKVS